ncbi:MAG: hypothetical protein Q8K18_09960 [Burkholderiales bacterium]|nr:hypothetical protein [Burkholderiales bacterium]
MSTQQILIRLPEDVAARFKAAVPARQRNKFIADLVAKAVARQEDELTRIAAAVTDEELRNPELAQEMRDWEATIGDGMEEHAANEKPRAR